MLVTLLIWGYITAVCYVAGRALLALMGQLRLSPATWYPWPLLCLVGSVALTILLGYVQLGRPIDSTVHLVTLSGLVGYAFWQKPFRLDHHKPDIKSATNRVPWLWLGMLLVVGLTILIRSTQLPRLNDTGGYHAPMIEWIRQYAVVPGLANLNYRFGFNNSWFLLNAFFAFPLPGASPANGLAGLPSPWHGINGWLMLMGVAYAVTISRKTSLAWLWVCFMAGLLLIFHWTLASPTPDLPAQLYAGLVIFLWLDKDGFRQEQPGSQAWLCLLFGLAAMTTKLSTVTVLLLPALVLFQALRRRQWPFLSVAGITIIVGTGYWWVGNVILTGYLFYPTLSPFADLFDVDWKVPQYLIRQGLFNLADGTKAGYSGPAWHVWTWVPHWFATRQPIEQLTAILLAMSPVTVLSTKRGATNRWHYGYVWALTTATLGTWFWFLLAPDLRFGAASVLFLLLLVYGPLVRQLAEKTPIQYRQLASIGVTILLTVSLLIAAAKREPAPWLLPRAYPNPALKTVTLGSQTLYLATDRTDMAHGIRGYWSNCFAASLPCAPYVPAGLQMRGKSLGKGFRVVMNGEQ